MIDKWVDLCGNAVLRHYEEETEGRYNYHYRWHSIPNGVRTQKSAEIKAILAILIEAGWVVPEEVA